MELIICFTKGKRFAAIYKGDVDYIVQTRKKPHLFHTFEAALAFCYGRGYIKEYQLDLIPDTSKAP